MFYTWSEVVLDIYLGTQITSKVSLNSYLNPQNCGPSVRILTKKGKFKIIPNEWFWSQPICNDAEYDHRLGCWSLRGGPTKW